MFCNGHYYSFDLRLTKKPAPEIFAEIRKGSDFRHRGESAAAAVTSLVFRIALFAAVFLLPVRNFP